MTHAQLHSNQLRILTATTLLCFLFPLALIVPLTRYIHFLELHAPAFPGGRNLCWLLGLIPCLAFFSLSLALISHAVERYFRLRCPHCNFALTTKPQYTLHTGICRQCLCRIFAPPQADPQPIRFSRIILMVIIALATLLAAFTIFTLSRPDLIEPKPFIPFGIGSTIALPLLLVAWIITWNFENALAKSIAQIQPVSPSYPFLYVMEIHRCLQRRYFKLYCTPDRLCFARIAGHFYDPQSLRQQCLRKRDEALADSIDPASENLLALHRANFHLLRSEIHTIQFASRPAGMTSGLLTITLPSGARRFYVHSPFTPDELNAIIHHAPSTPAPQVTS